MNPGKTDKSIGDDGQDDYLYVAHSEEGLRQRKWKRFNKREAENRKMSQHLPFPPAPVYGPFIPNGYFFKKGQWWDPLDLEALSSDSEDELADIAHRPL